MVLMINDPKILTMIRDTVHSVDANAQIVLYGSRARGDARPDSDWDVLIITDRDKVGFAEHQELVYPLYLNGLEYGQEINAFVYTRSQWDNHVPSLFYYNVQKEGVVL